MKVDLVAEFTAVRPRLMGVAYSLTGSVAEAEDVVQEAWLRLQRSDTDQITDVTGWLVATVSRLAVDVLRSARVRRESYVGPWLPEPVVTDGDPADRVAVQDSLNLALLVVLESLSPGERAVFVLHEVFGVPFAEVATAVGRSPEACRQLARRARGHVAARAPRFEADASEHRRVVAAFAAAAEGESLTELIRLLDPEVVLRSDGGGVVRAARRPVRGGAKVARFLVGVARRFGAGAHFAPADVNGRAGLLRYRGDRVESVYGFAVAAGRITEIDLVINPEKLRSVS